jgi:hypothetical protein
MRESALMVDIADGAVANRLSSGYDYARVPGFERMIGPIHFARATEGTRP